MDAALFDWDGTLADSLESFYTANRTVLGELGIAFDRARYREAYTPDWRIFYRRLGVPDDRIEAANARWRSVFVPAARPLPGVVEALSHLASVGVRLGIVTATSRDIVQPQIEAFGLGQLLEVRVCGDDLDVHKPDPRPLRLALDRLGLTDRPGAVAYVGDAPDDMRMARTVGTMAVAVESMLGERSELLAAGAEAVFPSVAAWVRAGPDRRGAAA
jgi:pyrophosphatase PpaX